MTERTDNPSTRREFFGHVTRGAILASLGVVSAVLAVRGRRAAAEQRCISDGLCRGCPSLADCVLPRGMSARKVLRES